MKGNGLEYHYVDVVPDYGQQHGSYAYMLGSTAVMPDMAGGEATRLATYILDGDLAFAPLIKFAVNAQTVGVIFTYKLYFCVSSTDRSPFCARRSASPGRSTTRWSDGRGFSRITSPRSKHTMPEQ